MTAEARRALFALYRRQGEEAWLQTTGDSMRPLIRRGAWLLVHFGAPPARRGDIVLLWRGDRFVAHRVVSLVPLTTKGDGERRFDRPSDAEEVFGVVRAVRRHRDGRARTFGCTGPSARLAGWASLLAGWLRERLG